MIRRSTLFKIELHKEIGLPGSAPPRVSRFVPLTKPNALLELCLVGSSTGWYGVQWQLQNPLNKLETAK